MGNEGVFFLLTKLLEKQFSFISINLKGNNLDESIL